MEIDKIYKEVLIEKLKTPEKWTVFKDDIISTLYYRINCFDDKEIYFKITVSDDRYDGHTVYVSKDEMAGGMKLSITMFKIEIGFFEIKMESLIDKLRKYYKKKKIEEEKARDIKLKESLLPITILRSFKIRKIKKSL